MSDEDPVTKPPSAPLKIWAMSQTPDRSAHLLDAAPICPECDYDLTGAPGNRCPWCGWRIDLDELAAAAASRRSGMRWGIAAAALLVGISSFVILSAQLSHGTRLTWHDALAALAVLIAVVGHLYLAGLAVRGSGKWPMRAHEAAAILRFVGWLSIASGVVASTSVFSAAPTSPTVPDVAVNAAIEFMVTGFFLSLPGTMLLILRLVSFRHSGEKYLSRFAGLRSRGGARRTGAPFVVEVEGPYAADQLSQTRTGEARPTAPDIEDVIARTWEAKMTLAARTDRTLYNGRLARLVRWEAPPTGLHLWLSDTCYRDFLGTNLFNAAAVARSNPRSLADALGTSCIVITPDGYIVLGLRSGRVAFHAGFLHTFGGMLEEADRRVGGYDVFGGARREVVEELGVDDTEIARIVMTGMVRDRAIRQPELLFDLNTSLTRPELAARFHPGLSDGEHTAIEFLSDNPEAVVRSLVRTSQIAPVAQAGLLLHGKHNWGADWYEQTCRLLYGEVPSTPPHA